MSPPSSAGLVFEVALQTRGVGAIEGLQGTLPRWGLEAFAAATRLGDVAVLIGLAYLAYLAYDRHDGAFVLGALLLGFAVTVAAKHWFGLPRPPAELQYVAETGLGFPSGHAIGSTVAWGSLAVVLERVSTARRRAVAAGIVVVTVSLSRVAIGVHYLVDVVVGVAVGLVVLGVAVRWLRDEPLGLLGLAGGVAALAVAISGGAVESFALLGGVAGGLTGWQIVEPGDRPFGQRGVFASGGVGVVLAGGLAVNDPTAALVFAGAALLAIGLIVAPRAGDRWLPA